MSNLKPNTAYIYTSPDGGETVYANEIGSTEKILIGISPKAQSIIDQREDEELWRAIRHAAKTNKSLQTILDHAILTYKLIK
jgi:hypothetical protein